MRRLFAAFILCLGQNLAAASGLGELSSSDAGSGLKEALTRGAEFAISNLGKQDGFLGNPKVKIPLPGSLQKAEKGLRAIGMGKQAEELVTTMNRAAEQAVVEAKPILVNAIKNMSWQDAKGILAGGDDAATQFFKRTTSAQIGEKFQPIVKQATAKVKLGKQYNKFAGKAAAMGLIDEKDADLDSYVTQKAMDGLFLMIAEEEKKLRANPLGAGSDLLKKVFGAL